MKTVTIFCAVSFFTILAGCGSSAPAKPTYNEALQTYKTELELLDRLKSQKATDEERYKVSSREMNSMLIQFSEKERQPYQQKWIAEREKMEELLREDDRQIASQLEDVREAGEILESVKPKKPAK